MDSSSKTTATATTPATPASLPYQDDAEAQLVVSSETTTMKQPDNDHDSSQNMPSHSPSVVTLARTCQLAAATAFLMVGLGMTWHAITGNGNGGCLHHSGLHSQHLQQREQPFLSDESIAMQYYRGAPHSMAGMDQVVSKTLVHFNPEDYYTLQEDLSYDTQDTEDDGDEQERMLDSECLVDVTIETECNGCDDWIANSKLQEWPWCHSELTEMTFTYTGCACGAWYTIDYGNSSWANGTGHSTLVYECWEPDFVYNNESEIPADVLCEDYTTLLDESLGGDPSIEYFQAGETEVHWIATNAADATDVVGEGIVVVGDEYTVSSGDPSVPLPDFVNLTFFLYDLEGEMVPLQTNVMPSAFCPGYPDAWYRHGYANTHILEVQDLTTGNISTRGSVQEDAMWIKLTIDASESPVPVRLDELNLVTNMNPDVINLTDAVYDVELDGGWMTMQSYTRSSISGRTSLHGSMHLRPQLARDESTMELMVGPFTVDLYWRTRYTFFTTVIASLLDDKDVLCNGFDFHEYIAGMG